MTQEATRPTHELYVELCRMSGRGLTGTPEYRALKAEYQVAVDGALRGYEHESEAHLRNWVRENRAEATKAWSVVEHLEMEISEKTACIERDRREPDKVLLHVASLRRALERRNAV